MMYLCKTPNDNLQSMQSKMLTKKSEKSYLGNVVPELNQTIIDYVKDEVVSFVCGAIGGDVRKIILYGSCSRGDFSEDSDIDIALLVSCNRAEINKYSDVLAEIATQLAAKYLAIVNFVCLPENEFADRKDWYPYYRNIEQEGKLLYGRQVL